MKNKQLLIAFTLVLFLVSCDKKTSQVEEKREEAVFAKAPEFNPDSAYSYIQKQVDFGPRVPNSASHTACAEYLASKLKSLGAEVSFQEFEAKAYNGTILKLKNIIGTFKPSNPKRILLAAHWDTRPIADKDRENKTQPIDGANDGGSGVAVLLEVARLLTANDNYNVGVDIIFFDGEDYGDPAPNNDDTWCLGSQYWAKNKHQAGYAAYYGILLDMVGAKGAQFSKEGYSVRYARQIVNKVWETGQKLGYNNYFLDYEDGEITDDHRYVNEIAKIPMIDIIELHPEGGFGDYHHTLQDNMDIIDKETLKAIGQTVVQVLYNEAAPEGI